jgi:thioesterase domain-containing protein/acyl carrier protein
VRARPDFGVIKITPIHLGLLGTMLDPADAPGAARTLVVGADFLSAEPTVFWQENAPGVRLMNEYGPTETVVGCSAYVLPPGRHRAGPVPVGRPIQNLTFHVLDGRLEPVPVGLPGELYIGGAGVARGYLGRPGLTAEKFLPDPFAGAGARMYRSGDRARWLHDGNLLILGRTDHQVKVRGYRVELGEIEAGLRRHDSVRECVVMLREDRPGDRRLVAYVVGDPGRTDPAALREHLRRSLPEYMVPAAFVVLSELPQTSTGKLDRRTLPAPDYGAADGEREAPRDALEARLVAIWQELLGVEGIGAAQGFFELGGNSLLALRLFARVRRELGCELPVATLFAGGTVRHLADAIRARGAPASAPPPVSPLVALRAEGTLPPLFCVHPAGRTVSNYAGIVHRLGADQPVFGVQDAGADLSRPIPQIAADHLRALRAARPEGPYHLLGWSFGGYVAYEMAVQLERAGETVAFVGLLDTMSPTFARTRADEGGLDVVIGMAEDVAMQLGRPLTLDPTDFAGLDFDGQLKRAVEMLHAHGAAPAGFDAEALRDHCGVIRDRNRSMAAYRPGALGAPLTLFPASEHPDDYEAYFALGTEEERRTLGWCRVTAGPVEVFAVPGAHVTLGLEPHAATVAALLRQRLAAAREAAFAEVGR